jgi:hypothetical protein
MRERNEISYWTSHRQIPRGSVLRKLAPNLGCSFRTFGRVGTSLEHFLDDCFWGVTVLFPVFGDDVGPDFSGRCSCIDLSVNYQAKNGNAQETTNDCVEAF